MMGGEIGIESEVGKGATFAFTVQMERGEKQKQIFTDRVMNWNNVRVLVVDDDTYILEDFKGIVEGFGATCDVALNAMDALELLDKNSYNICFIDWKMPVMNGIEMTRELKKRIYKPDPVVVMISSAEISTIVVEAKEAGVDKFLQKPLFPSPIADIISECLGLSESLPEEIRTDINGIFSGHCILLVEDVEINREIVQAILAPTELEIDCAVNGTQAVRMFSESPDKYEMIFMDLQMPEMDGYEATRRIRTLDVKRAGTVPIIAMTANVFKEDIENCLAAGMNDHIGKPLDLDDLFEKLNNNLLYPEEAGKIKNFYNLKQSIAWDDSLLLGDARVDMQHQKIFELANDIINTCEDGSSTKKVKETLDFMVDYAVQHFADEEILQLEYDYPEYKDHKQSHDEFKVTVGELLWRFYEIGSSVELSNEVNEFLFKWLTIHIQKEDKKIVDYIRNIAADERG